MIHLALTMGLLALTHVLCLAAISERKYSVRKTILVYAAFCAVFIGWTQAVFFFFGSESPYTAFTSFSVIIIAFFVFILTSADAFCKKVFLFISYSNFFCIFFCIAALAGDAMFPALSETGTLYIRNIIRTLLYLPAVFVYLKFLRVRIRAVPGTKKRTWYSISLVSVLFLTVFTSFVVLFYLSRSHTVENVFLFAAVVLIYCSVLWIIFGTIRYMTNESKMEQVSKNAEYLQRQLAFTKENERMAKTIRHDIRHHNQNIAALLQKDDIKEALRYIRQYDDSLEASKPKEFCPHVTVNAILSQFSARAEKEGIPVSISVDTPEKSPIADMDFVAVLSNLLENALNGCRECGSHGEIRVNIREVAGKTVIVCSNPCKPDLAVKNGMLREKGTGIDSVILAVRKYDGDIRYKLENEYLTVCVILNADQLRQKSSQ